MSAAPEITIPKQPTNGFNLDIWTILLLGLSVFVPTKYPSDIPDDGFNKKFTTSVISADYSFYHL